MRKKFIEKQFSDESLRMIEVCDEILEQYADDGFDLTLRQLFYQLVSRNHAENTVASYKRVGGLVSDARLAGLLDWDRIVDRVRETVRLSTWDGPKEIVDSAIGSFRTDKWKDQPIHCEVFCEKDALSGVFEPTCAELEVPFTANRGYSSQSFMYRKGWELARKLADGKDVYVLYLGDHDPSGLDMDRDVQERLLQFIGGACSSLDGKESDYVDEKGFGYYDEDGNAEKEGYGDFHFMRLALWKEQIVKWNLTPNPAKLTDSRAELYIDEHGHDSWELDAIEPKELIDIVQCKVEELRDPNVWDESLARQEEMRDRLIKLRKKMR